MIAWRQRLRLPHPVVLWTIGGAWALAILAEAIGKGEELHHDALLTGSLPFGVALLLFLVAWQAMTAAMMLPSSLPLIVLFDRAIANVARAGRARVAFLGGYAAVWTGFGALAFAGDLFVHELVHEWAWLDAHPGVIAGSTLLLAGAFQFSELKEKCLKACRNPGAYLMRHYRRGTREAFKLGWGHGIFCLGCCWAMMLVAVAAGFANLWWMAAFTAIMVFEKTGKGGERGVLPIGVGLIAAGSITLIAGIL